MAAEYIDVGCTTENGTLYVEGEIMHRPAFTVMDVSPLWQGPDQRGTNLMIPGRPGTIAMPKRAAETMVSLRMLLDGRRTVGGGAKSNYSDGLFDITMWLRALTAPTPTPRNLTLYAPDGITSIGGTGQLRFTLGDRVGPLQRALLEITLPEGYLT